MSKRDIPAFPALDNFEGELSMRQAGMTLRDYFAAKAMQGDWASQSESEGSFTNDLSDIAIDVGLQPGRERDFNVISTEGARMRKEAEAALAAAQQEKKDVQSGGVAVSVDSADSIAHAGTTPTFAPVPEDGYQAQDAAQQAPAPATQATAPAAVKCDGNHGGPRCADPECWNDDEIVFRDPPENIDETTTGDEADPADFEPTLNLSAINARLAPLSISCAGLAQFDIEPLATDKNAKLYSERQLALLCHKITEHVAPLTQNQWAERREMEAA